MIIEGNLDKFYLVSKFHIKNNSSFRELCVQERKIVDQTKRLSLLCNMSLINDGQTKQTRQNPSLKYLEIFSVFGPNGQMLGFLTYRLLDFSMEVRERKCWRVYVM